MKKRKIKSRMTRVDLDAALKLQRDYCDLQYEVKRAFECVVALTRGEPEPLTLAFDNDLLSGLTSMVRSYVRTQNVTQDNK